jgi:hypothetical protein
MPLHSPPGLPAAPRDAAPPARSTRPLIVVILALALLVYAALGVILAHRWLAPAAALLVAVLLWQRHRRARFSAYVLFSAMGARALITGAWPALLFAAGAVALLQTPAARQAWPRLKAGWCRRRGHASG